MSKRAKTTHEIVAFPGFRLTRESKEAGHRFSISLKDSAVVEALCPQVVAAVQASEEFKPHMVVTKVFSELYNMICVYLDSTVTVDRFLDAAKVLRTVPGLPAKLVIKSNKNFTETVWETSDGSGASTAAAAAVQPPPDGFATIPAWIEPERVFDIPYERHALSGVDPTPLTDDLKSQMVAFLDNLEGTTHSRHGTEQGSEAWLKARSVVVTASTFGAAVGHNKYSSPFALVKEKLFETKPQNDAMRYGTEHEDTARRAFWTSVSTRLRTDHGDGAKLIPEGLITRPQCPWMAVSPDNILLEICETDGLFSVRATLVEYKCPFGKRFMATWPFNNEPYRIPLYYYDQLQGIMGYVNECCRDRFPSGLMSAYFVVWTERGLFCMTVPFSEDYYRELKKDLWRWYLQVFVPSLILGTVAYVPEAEAALSEKYFC